MSLAASQAALNMNQPPAITPARPLPRTGAKASILDTIGNTPLVRINNLGPRHVELYVKVEAFNPMGSVKDRFALAAIEAAEKSGALARVRTLLRA